MRQTPLLKTVLFLLKQARKPLSVPELQFLLSKENLDPNKTTLYRMLEKLVEDGTVEALLLDPKIMHYEFKTHHHHHFRCQSCDGIACIDDPDLEIKIHELEQKLQHQGFGVVEHSFSLMGKCKTCL